VVEDNFLTITEELNMEFLEEDYRQLLVADRNRKTAEENYAKNPLDADVCITITLIIFI